MSDHKLSDKALSVFTFAAYHTFVSGDQVSEVVLRDGSGHRADPDGVEELRAAGLLEIDGERGRFTDAGEAMVGRVVEGIRGAATK